MPQLSLQQLTAFLVSCEEGSFSAAARRLGKAQPAVSVLIQNLEQVLGVSLFERDKKLPILSKEGESLKQYAEEVIKTAAQFEQAADTYARSVETELSIAIENFVEPENLYPLLKQFSNKFPYTDIQLLNPNGDEIIEMLRAGRVQIGFLLARDSYPDGVEFSFMGNQMLSILVSPNHPLATKKQVSIKEIGSYHQFIITSGPKAERLQISEKAWYCEHISSALELASQGLGWTYASPNQYQHYTETNRLITLRVPKSDGIRWTLGLDVIWTATSAKNQAAAWFLSNFNIST